MKTGPPKIGPPKTGPPKTGPRSSKTEGVKSPPADVSSIETKLCLLPSPINGYLIYTSMGVISCIWIVGTHYLCWKRLKKPVYIELDNLASDEEDLRDRLMAKRIWRGDFDSMTRDCVSLFIFIVIGFVLQIIGVY